MRLIVTRPYYDIPTKYISGWAEEIISFAQNKGINVVDLEKEKANKTILRAESINYNRIWYF